MVRPQDKSTSSEIGVRAWEDDGGCVEADQPNRDLNSLLAREQTSIMSAEAAAAPALYEMHRNASLHARQLINATSYPEHEPHVFAQERAEKADNFEEELRNLTSSVERNERLLAIQFSDGKVSPKSFHSRSRFLRQDRARLSNTSDLDHAEKAS